MPSGESIVYPLVLIMRTAISYPSTSPFVSLNCYYSESVQENKSITIKKKKELVAILVPIACGCVLPIMVVWLAIRKLMNETNKRTQIVLAAITDTSEDAVKKQLSRGRDKLKERLKL